CCRPWPSAQRVYVRICVSAQSWGSVPPAPGWMVSSASRASSGLRSMFCSSSASSCAPICSASVPSSGSSPSSSSISASSLSPWASSRRLRSARYGSSQRFSSLTSWTTCRAFSASAQMAPSAMVCSSSASRLVFPSTSKEAPQLAQAPVEVAKPLGESHRSFARSVTREYTLEDLAPSGENLVQRLGPEGRAPGEIGADLLGVLLPALLDLVLEQKRQRAVADPLLPLLRVVDHEVGDERPGGPRHGRSPRGSRRRSVRGGSGARDRRTRWRLGRRGPRRRGRLPRLRGGWCEHRRGRPGGHGCLGRSHRKHTVADRATRPHSA